MPDILKISVVVPIHNEAELLIELHRRLSSVLTSITSFYEIVFVDDGSKDESLKTLSQIQKGDSKVTVVELSRNFGQTAALAAGIDVAGGEVIVTMDGDLQHAPEEIPRFLVELEKGYDLVSGWREVRTDSFFIRRIPSFIANRLVRILTKVEMRDFGSTFKAYRGELLKRLELFGELHRFIPVLANRVGARIVEIPISVHPRTKGSSKYGISRTFGVLQDIIFLEFYANYLTKPMRAFGKLFMLFFGAGFFISSTLMLLWGLGLIPNVLAHGALLLFSVFLMIIGIQFLGLGVLAELLTRIYMKTTGNKIYSIRTVHH